jgi:hypothetical protein
MAITSTDSDKALPRLQLSPICPNKIAPTGASESPPQKHRKPREEKWWDPQKAEFAPVLTATEAARTADAIAYSLDDTFDDCQFVHH